MAFSTNQTEALPVSSIFSLKERQRKGRSQSSFGRQCDWADIGGAFRKKKGIKRKYKKWVAGIRRKLSSLKICFSLSRVRKKDFLRKKRLSNWPKPAVPDIIAVGGLPDWVPEGPQDNLREEYTTQEIYKY